MSEGWRTRISILDVVSVVFTGGIGGGGVQGRISRVRGKGGAIGDGGRSIDGGVVGSLRVVWGSFFGLAVAECLGSRAD